MTRTSPPQVAFSSGELDPLLHRRFDYQRFQTGLAKCRGFIPLAQGGFTRAPGTIHRGYTAGNAAAVLVPFEFADNDALVLEFTHLKMRVWRYGAMVLSAGLPYELATPYAAADLPNLRWVQSADVIYLADGKHPIQRLARYALNNWTIVPQVYSRGPFRVQNLTASLTVQASATTGAITLTASAALFAANHIGSLMMLQPTDFTTIPLFTTNEAVTVGHLRRNGDNVYELTMRANANVGQNAPIHTEGEALTDNGTKWKFISDSTGIVRITAVTDATHASATVLKSMPKACVDSPTYRWSEGAWSDRYGYPGAIDLYDQRLIAAATPTEPRTVWFSAIGDYADFQPGTEADEAFAYTIAGDGSVNKIVGLRRGSSGLHIFALGEEYSTRSETRAQAIGPTTATFGLDSSIGASPARPIAPRGNPIFISRDKRRIMEIAYSFQSDANEVRPLSRIAQHLGVDGFEEIVWQGSPEPTAWLRQSTGDLVAMVYDATEDVLGWAPLPVAGGVVESMAVSPAADGSADVVTLVVRRTINGATVRMVEELAPIYGTLTGAEPIAEACHLFAAAIFDPETPTAAFTVAHLVGQQVYAWTDAGEFGPITVPVGGAITLPAAVGRATIGLFDATHFVETLDIQAAAADGNTMGRQKRLYSGCAIGLHRTAQLRAAVVERRFAEPERQGKAANIVPRQVAADLSQGFTGISVAELPSGHATEVALRIYPYSGAPATVTAIVPTVQEAGR